MTWTKLSTGEYVTTSGDYEIVPFGSYWKLIARGGWYECCHSLAEAKNIAASGRMTEETRAKLSRHTKRFFRNNLAKATCLTCGKPITQAFFRGASAVYCYKCGKAHRSRSAAPCTI